MITPGHGLVAAYVRGGRGRRMRPVLIPGNLVSARLRARTDSQLPQATLELARSRAALLEEPLPACAVEWVTALTAAALPERQPYPGLFDAAVALLEAIEAAPSARGWSSALVRFELLLLAELGYGREWPALPEWVRSLRTGDWPEVIHALDLSGEGLFGDLLAGHSAALKDSRARLVDRLRQLA